MLSNSQFTPFIISTSTTHPASWNFLFPIPDYRNVKLLAGILEYLSKGFWKPLNGLG
jgi:hypothetical protein